MSVHNSSKINNNNMIQWISKEELNSILQEGSKRYMVTNFCGFSYNSNNIRKFMPFEPDATLLDFAEPNPCLKWYGRAPFLFQLAAYLNEGKNEFSIISLFSTDSVETTWEILKDLNIPFNFVKNITFVEGVRNSSYALYSVDEYDLSFELYRGKSEHDVASLQEFLFDHNFNRKLFIGKSEISPAEWLAFEGEKNIARYGNKYLAERFALKRSKSNNSLVNVYSPDIPNSIIIFENGIKRKFEA